ncbi:TetR/AcrR family transcriptional regulator [Solibacillus sp. FSL W8-0474]|uniref:TetR/AcrR family transcriptional regulator n=1 Tax=Solibacillus sp. FSL W8-0474 TaxID=2975336 RepID=UPI0030FA2836
MEGFGINHQLTERQKKALLTKEKLYITALDLFTKHGFEHVSVEQITKACNVSKGTFYTHFPSKYDVILEKFEEMDNYYIEIEKNIPDHFNAVEKILFIFREQMIYLQNHVGKDMLRTVYTAAMTKEVEKNHFLINPQRKIFQMLRQFVIEGINQHEFKPDVTLEVATKYVERCMRANVYDWLIHDESFDLVEEMVGFTGSMLDGLIVK